MPEYKVYYSYNMNIPVEFTIDSKKELTEEQIQDFISKKPLECSPQFDSTMVSDEEKEFYDSMDKRKKWKSLMQERMTFDDFAKE